MATIAEALDAATKLYERGDLAGAERMYRQVLEAQPLVHEANLAEAYFKLGAIWQRQGRADEAIGAYQNAIRLRPHSAEAWHNLGTLHKSRDDLNAAIECYAKALEFKPNFAESLKSLGDVFQAQGRAIEARVCYEQSLRIKASERA